MNHVMTLNATYLYGAPFRYFGAWFASAPGFSGGDLSKSKDSFERAIAVSDTYFGTKVSYAEFYAVKAEDKSLFTRLLREVTDGNPETLPDVIPEQKLEQQKAEQLLSRTSELFQS
jgi:hypothetical protein